MQPDNRADKDTCGSQLDYTILMSSRHLRTTLLLAGLVLICLSLVLLAYAVWPAGVLREQSILAPTVFAPP